MDYAKSGDPEIGVMIKRREWVEGMEIGYQISDIGVGTGSNIIEKKVWEVVLPPPNTNIVGSCWTHICKCNQDRTARAKSRVVAQGFTQTFGIDYDKTYAPVSQLASLWTICSIAAWNDWLIHQMDIYNAYVNADLEEPIYM